ncbi:MAG TPA: sigma-70 family RNA polymerase sigma factor [Gemmatimonadaceae bacterium]
MTLAEDQVFIRLVRENDMPLRRIARIYARDADAQKDLYQDMLVQLWRSFPSFAGASSAGTWLYRVALNTALAHVRRRSARRETPLAEEHDRTDDAGGVEERIDAQERVERLYAAIDRLSVTDKMLTMMYLDEKTYREMADVLGITESNVGVRLHRIRKELAAWLSEEPV